MTKHEFITAVQTTIPNDSLVAAIERKYSVPIPERIAKILSVMPQGGFLSENDLCRVMSSSEIISATENLHTNFVGKKLIPIFDLSDNLFVVFDSNSQGFGRFSLNDELMYRRSDELNEIL